MNIENIARELSEYDYIILMIIFLLGLGLEIYAIWLSNKEHKADDEYKKRLIDELHFADPYLEELLELFKACNPNFTANQLHDQYQSILQNDIRFKQKMKIIKESERQLFFELRTRSVKRRQNYQSRKRRSQHGINRYHQRHI